MTGERKTELDKDALEKASYAWCRLNSGNVACEEQEITCVNCIGHVTPIITAYLTALPQSALSSRLVDLADRMELASEVFDWGQYVTTLRDAAALLRGGIPEGWKLVPVEPTESMCKAGRRMAGQLAMSMRGYTGHITDEDWHQWPEAYEYRTMIAAAPPLTPGEQK